MTAHGTFLRRMAAAVLAIGLATGASVAETPADDLALGLAALDRQDYPGAARAFAAAAEAGAPDGLFYLGRMHELGLGTAVSLPVAAELFARGSEAGSALAGNRLGLMYLDGTGVVQDYAYGRELVCAAAEAGLDQAQFNCGVLWADGRGGETDPARAVDWYRLAAEQGHVGAMNLLGLALAGGAEGVPQDLAAARGWLERTAALGNPVGLFALGQFHAEGLGVERDLVAAHVWFNLAAAYGHPQGAEARGQIEALLTPEQIRDAQKMARDWRPETGAEPAPVAE